VKNTSNKFIGSPKIASRIENSNKTEYLSFLYEDNEMQKDKKNQMDQMWERINLKECSFKPVINSSPNKEDRKIIQERLLEQKSMPTFKLNKECSFKPRLNLQIKKIK